jgi:hypothetical protein
LLSDHRNGEFVGCGGLRPWLYTPGEANFEVGFHLVKRCWGKGFATEAAFGALEYAWEKLRLSQVYAGHHPHNRAKRRPRDGTLPHRHDSEFLLMVSTSAAHRFRTFVGAQQIR